MQNWDYRWNASYFVTICTRNRQHYFGEIVDGIIDTNTEIKNQFGPQRKNLASIIRGFKSTVTKQAHEINADFSWQPRFNDHIIHNNHSSDRIQNYIKANIKNWKTDEFYE